jgi:hypothetical protein
MIYFMYFYKFIKIKIIILCPYFALSSMISSQSHKLCSFELLRIIAHSAFFVDDYYMMHSYEVPSWIPRDMIDHLTCLSSIHEEGSTILFSPNSMASMLVLTRLLTTPGMPQRRSTFHHQVYDSLKSI